MSLLDTLGTVSPIATSLTNTFNSAASAFGALSGPPAPSSQKTKKISFILRNYFTDKTVQIVLSIRPEDLTRVDPARVNVQQTLGGAWGDSFGKGLATINISGITGWRPGADGKDGIQRFIDLKTTIFDGYHQWRADNIKQGKIPEGAYLMFIDTLDQFGAVVVLNSFVLRRSKSRPLLMQYQISMTVLHEPSTAYNTMVAPTATPAIAGPGGALGSLLASIKAIISFAQAVTAFITNNILAPLTAFMKMTASIYNAVFAAIQSIDGIAASLINVARATSQAGANIFRTLAAIAGLPTHIKADLMAVAGAYTNIFCLINNVIKAPQVYQDYTPLFGASNCSSTSGGAPLSVYAGTNPFYTVAPAPSQQVASISPQAQTALQTMASSDPVLAPMSTAQMSSSLNSVNSGIVLNV